MSVVSGQDYYWAFTGDGTLDYAWLYLQSSDGSYVNNHWRINSLLFGGWTSIGYVDMGLNASFTLARDEDWLTLSNNIVDTGHFRLNLKGVEYIDAPLDKNISLEVVSKEGFTTDGSMISLSMNVGNHTLNYWDAARDSTLFQGSGWDTVNLNDNPDIPGTQYWSLIRRSDGQIDAYSLFSGNRIRLEGGTVTWNNNNNTMNYGEVEKFFMKNARTGGTETPEPGNVIPTTGEKYLDINIDLRSYEGGANTYFSDSFNLAYFNYIRYTSDNVWTGEATIYEGLSGRYSAVSNTQVAGATVLPVAGTNRNGTHDLIVGEQASYIDGQLRLYAFNVASGSYNTFNDVFLGDSGVDGKSYSGNTATAVDRVAMYGFGGNDILTGGSGNDYIFGGQGYYNQLTGDTGNQITGGAGADFFGVGNTNTSGTVTGSNTWVGYNGGEAELGYAADRITDWDAGTDTLEVLSNGVAVISGLYGVIGMAGNNTLDLRDYSSVVTVNQDGDSARGNDNWDSTQSLQYVYDNQTSRDLQSIKNEGSDVTVVNNGLIIARGQGGNDTVYGSAGNDYIYGNEGRNLLNLSEGGNDRAFLDTRSGKQYVSDFNASGSDKFYLAKNIVDAFGGNSGRSMAIYDTISSGYNYTHGSGYSQGIDFLYGLTYKSYLSNAYGSQPYTNDQSYSMDLSADVTTYVSGIVSIGIGIGLCFIPFIGPALGAPLIATGTLLTAGKIYSDLGNTSLGSVPHINPVYDLTPGGASFTSNYVYVLNNPERPATTAATGSSLSSEDNLRFLDFFPQAYKNDGFTAALELNPGYGFGGDTGDGIFGYFVVYSNSETFVYLVTSQDHLIENHEAMKVAELSGFRSASDFVVYDSNYDPYNQRADAAVVLKKPTITQVIENSGPTYTANVPLLEYTQSPYLKVLGSIASIDPGRTATTTVNKVELFDSNSPENGVVGTAFLGGGATTFEINDTRVLGQLIIQTDYSTVTGALNPLSMDNTFEYQDRRVIYYATLYNDVDGDGEMVIETRSNTFSVIDNGPSTATVDGGAGTDTLMLESTSLHLNNASDAQILSIEMISVKPPMGPGLSVTVSGGAVTSVNILDAGAKIADGTYDLTLSDDTTNSESGATGWKVVVSGGKVTSVIAGSGGSGYTESTYANAEWVPVGVTIDIHAQSEGFTVTGYQGADSIIGAQGNDVINGLNANDTIDGGTGNDTIEGGAGQDNLSGSAGGDTFVVTSVSDFATGETISGGSNASTVDRLKLSQVSVSGTPTAPVTSPATGTYSSAQLSGSVTGVEVIELAADADYSLTLANGIYAGVDADGNGSEDNTLTITPTVNLTHDVTIVGGATSSTHELKVLDNGFLDGNDSITGGAGNDTLEGGIGNDTMSGGAIATYSGSDSIDAGGGNDLIEQTLCQTVNDTIIGGADVDKLTVTQSNGLADLDNVTQVETIELLSGLGANFSYTISDASAFDADTTGVTIDGDALASTEALVFSATNLTRSITILGGAGNDTIIDGGGNDSIVANAGNDNITLSGAGVNTVSSGSGTDSIILGAGTDLVDAGNQNDTVVGGANVTVADTLDGGADIDLLTISDDNNTDDLDNVTRFETIRLAAGQSYQYVIGNNSLFDQDTVAVTVDAQALGAGDAINFDASNLDRSITILFGAGDDTIYGGNGTSDSIHAGGGNDLIIMSNQLNGTDSIDGGSGNDRLTFSDNGTATSDLDHVTNIEVITLGDSVTSVVTVDALVASGQTLTIDATGLNGTNTLNWNGSGETNGHFSVDGSGNNDTITGGAGNDTLKGGLGNDTLSGGAIATYSGSDSIDAGGGNDLIVQTLYQTGNDTIIGGADIDKLTVTQSNGLTDLDNVTQVETIELLSGLGANFSYTISDASAFDADTTGVTIDGDALASTEALVFSATNLIRSITILGGAGNDTIIDGAGNDSIVTNAGNDNITLSGAGVNTVSSGSGTDSIILGAGTDYVLAGSDNDMVVGGANVTVADTLDGGSEIDLLTISNDNSTNDLNNVTRFETIRLAAGQSYQYVIGNNSLFDQDTVAVTVDAQALGSTDSVNFDASNLDRSISVFGGAGHDTLFGGAGADTLLGGLGNDILQGAGGSDSIVGGDGDDVFRYTDGTALSGDAYLHGGEASETLGDTIFFTTATTVVDADFSSSVIVANSIENVRLTEASSITLGSTATTAGIGKVYTGTGATSVVKTDTSALTVDATDLANNTTLTLDDSGVISNINVLDLTGNLSATNLAGTLAVDLANNTVDNSLSILLGSGNTSITGGHSTDTVTVTGQSVAGQLIDLSGSDANHVITTGGGVQTIISGTGVDVIRTGAGSLDGTSFDRIEFHLGSASANIGLTGTDADVMGRITSIVDYAEDTLDFIGTDSILSSYAGTGFSTSASGQVTFTGGAITLAEKITVLRSGLDVNGGSLNSKVVVFNHGDDSYVYSGGAAGTANDDQIVRIVGDNLLDTINITGSFKLTTAPVSGTPASAISLLPNSTTWTTGVKTYVPTSFDPGGASNTNFLLNGLGGSAGFGTVVPASGDDSYGLTTVPWGDLNMFGRNYSSLYMGTNGYVTFGSGYSSYTPSGIAGFTRSPMIAGQFDDLYVGAGAVNVASGSGSGNSTGNSYMYYYGDANKMVFTWNNVGLYGWNGSQATVGSAFQIILWKGVSAGDFGIEMRYEEVTRDFGTASAGWTAGDTVNYSLIDLNSATTGSNLNIPGVWAWEVRGGSVEMPYFVPDIGINSITPVAQLTFPSVFSTMPTIAETVSVSGDETYGFTMGSPTNSLGGESAILSTIATPHWNLWKDRYVDGRADITISAGTASKSLSIQIVASGLDTVTRTGNTLMVSSTSNDLNAATEGDIPTVTAVTAASAAAAVNINLSLLTHDITVTGSSAADTLTTGSGADSVDGGAGHDTIVLSGGNDTLSMSVAAASIDNADGGDQNDTLLLTGAAAGTVVVDLRVAAGVDQLLTINGSAENYVQTNFEIVNASSMTSAGLSATASGSGSSIVGSGQSDTLIGGAGNDSLTGGGGNDSITGGAGADSVSAGDGNDRINFAVDDLTSNDTVSGGNHTTGDTLVLTSSGTLVDADLTNVSTIEALQLADGTNAITLGGESESAGIVSIYGGTGADTITVAAYSTNGVTIDAGAGADVITGGAGNDTFMIDSGDVIAGESYDGGSGNADNLKILSSMDLSALDVAGSLNNVEIITLSDGVAVTFSGAFLSGETLALNGTTNNFGETVSVNGASGNDTINLSGITVDTNDITGLYIDGGNGNDIITGTIGVDTVLGGGGDDSIAGGGGADSLVGGAGNDVFVYNALTDTDSVGTLANMDTIEGAAFGDVFDLSSFPSYDAGSFEVHAVVAGQDDYIASWTSGGVTYSVYLKDTGVTTGFTSVEDAGLLTLAEAAAPSTSEAVSLLSGNSTLTYVSPNYATDPTAVTNTATEFQDGNNATRITLSMGAIDAFLGWHKALGFSKQADFTNTVLLTGTTVSSVPDLVVIDDGLTVTGYPASSMNSTVNVDLMLDSKFTWNGGSTDSSGLAVTTDGTNTYIFADVHYDRSAEDLTSVSLVNGGMYQRPLTGAKDAQLILTIAGLNDTTLISVADFVISGEVILGTSGADSKTGTTGDDGLHGGAGADTLSGGDGNDYLTGDASTGGSFADWFLITSGNDTILDLAAGNVADVVQVSAGATVAATVYGNWTATADTSNAGTATIDARGKTVVLTNAVGPNGWYLKDTSTVATAFTGSAFADTIQGGEGADTITGGAGVDRLVVDSGTDTVTDLGGTVAGSSQADILVVSAGATANVTVTNDWTATAATSNTSGIVNLTLVANDPAAVAGGYVDGIDIDLRLASGTSGYTIDARNTTTTPFVNNGVGGDGLTYLAGTDIFASAFADTILVGPNGAHLKLGGGADTVVLTPLAGGSTPGATVATYTGVIQIDDYVSGADIIDLDGVALTTGAQGTLGAGQASIAAGGGATFDVADDTAAERMLAVEAALSADAAVSGEFAYWGEGSDTYLFVSDGVAALSSGDLLVKLVGVSAVSVTLTAGNITDIIGVV